MRSERSGPQRERVPTLLEPLVCDASVMLSLLMSDEASWYGSEIAAASSQGRLHAPAIWPAEVLNSLRSNVLRERLDPRDVDAALEQLLRVRCQVAEAPPMTDSNRWLKDVAIEGGCSGYDASYLLLAARLEAVIATRDTNLRRVAGLLDLPCLPLSGASD